MKAEVLKFDHQFDATHMTLEQMKAEIYRRGWHAGRIDTGRLINGDGLIMVRRVTKKASEEYKR